MANNVTLDGNPIEIDGKFPQPGDNAAPFTLTSSGLEEVKLDNWAGKRKILNIIPSIDTGVCAASTRKFNEKASGLDNTVVLVISADLPFAAARFRSEEHTSELQSRPQLVCRLLLEKKKHRLRRSPRS